MGLSLPLSVLLMFLNGIWCYFLDPSMKPFMPLLILSFVFPFLTWTAGRWSWYLIFLSVLNAGGACVDLLNMILVAVQIPRKGIMVSNGYAAFYKGVS